LTFREGDAPLPSVRLVRFAKLTAAIADVSTVFCAVLIVGWQVIGLLGNGSWPALPLSLILLAPTNGEVYSTASIDKIGASWAPSFVDALLQVPIIMILLLAVAFLTAFYLWLSSVEKELTKTQI
jgi:hypothetical protein